MDGICKQEISISQDEESLNQEEDNFDEDLNNSQDDEQQLAEVPSFKVFLVNCKRFGVTLLLHMSPI